MSVRSEALLLLGWLATCLAGAAVLVGAHLAFGAPHAHVRFAPARCAFDLPAGQVEGTTVHCGVLDVPQDWTGGEGGLQRVRLPVAVFRATGEVTGPPLLMLQGGPGGSTLGTLTRAYTATAAAPLQAHRDLVFFDQRGTGKATPIPDCPSLSLPSASGDGSQVSAAALVNRSVALIAGCRKEVRAHGIEPARFTTAEAAGDAVALMRALGYRRWHVYGVSYGTFEALEVLRIAERSVVSVTLDSPLPAGIVLGPQGTLNIQRALETVFAQCRADAECDSRFPSLEERFYARIAGLVRKPLTLALRDSSTHRTGR